jgi:hypothetical protein
MRLVWGALLFGFAVILGCQEPSPEAPSSEERADTAQVQQAAPTRPDGPAWQRNAVTNPADGSETIVLQRTAREVRARSTADAPVLYVRCRGGATDLYIDWHDYIPGTTHSVMIRLDQGPTRARPWMLSRSNVATFYPEPPAPLLQEMMGARLLFAEATPYNTAPVTAVFALEGLAHEIQPLRDACGW